MSENLEDLMSCEHDSIDTEYPAQNISLSIVVKNENRMATAKNSTGVTLTRLWIDPISYTEHYKKKSHLEGSGKFGTVYKCTVTGERDMKVVEEDYAVKECVLSKDNLSVSINEIQIMDHLTTVQLKSKSNIGVPQYFASFITENHLNELILVIVMQYIKGPTLSELYKNNILVPQATLLRIMSSLFSFLKIFHDEHIYHSDIKLDNIKLDESIENLNNKTCPQVSNFVYFVDFGLSKFSSDITFPETGGTIIFFSPEKILSLMYSKISSYCMTKFTDIDTKMDLAKKKILSESTLSESDIGSSNSLSDNNFPLKSSSEVRPITTLSTAMEIITHMKGELKVLEDNLKWNSAIVSNISGFKYSAESDIWALCMCFYIMIFLQHPYSYTNKGQMKVSDLYDSCRKEIINGMYLETCINDTYNISSIPKLVLSEIKYYDRVNLDTISSKITKKLIEIEKKCKENRLNRSSNVNFFSSKGLEISAYIRKSQEEYLKEKQ